MCASLCFILRPLPSQAGYTEKTDVWSFGVMAYALLFNEFPYAPQVRDKERPRRLRGFHTPGFGGVETIWFGWFGWFSLRNRARSSELRSRVDAVAVAGAAQDRIRTLILQKCRAVLCSGHLGQGGKLNLFDPILQFRHFETCEQGRQGILRKLTHRAELTILLRI